MSMVGVMVVPPHPYPSTGEGEPKRAPGAAF